MSSDHNRPHEPNPPGSSYGTPGSPAGACEGTVRSAEYHLPQESYTPTEPQRIVGTGEPADVEGQGAQDVTSGTTDPGIRVTFSPSLYGESRVRVRRLRARLQE